MNAAFLLISQYDKASISIEIVCRDDFGHLTPYELVEKVNSGEIALPLVELQAAR